MSDTTWYDREGGACFECTGCGDCCKKPGVILLSEQDQERISAHLEMSRDQLRERYLRRYDASFWNIIVSPGRPCVFLDEADRCRIHEVKPWQCRAYPFWYEIVSERESWEAEAGECEGIDRGARVAPETIREWLAQDTLANWILSQEEEEE